jgi:hypothetical protein
MVVERERTSGYLPKGCMEIMLFDTGTMRVEEEEPEGVVVVAGHLQSIRKLAS